MTKNMKKFFSAFVLLCAAAVLFADNMYDAADKVTYSAELDYPFFLNYPTLNDLLGKLVKADEGSFSKAYNKAGFEALTSEPGRIFKLKVETVFCYDSKEFVSTILKSYALTGGANGDTHFISLTYDKAAQKPIDLKGFLTKRYGKEKFKNALSRLSEEVRYRLTQFASEKKIAFDEKVFKKATDANLKNFPHFAVTDDTLVVQFEQGSVFSYADGTPQVEVPLAMLQ